MILSALINTKEEVTQVENTIEVKPSKQFIQEVNTEISLQQVSFFEEKSEILLDMYKAKKTVSNDSILINNRELKNYTIEHAGNYINIRDTYTNYKYGFFSLGNKKLEKNNNTVYLIWNLTQQLSCPNATEICKKRCYANKYPNNARNNVIGRSKNLLLTTFTNFKAIFQEVINMVNTIYKGNVFIRIHESGDIYNHKYFMDLMDILHNNPYNNKALIYTKTTAIMDLIPQYSKNNVTIRYSIMQDTNVDLQTKVLENNINSFIAIPNVENVNTTVCPGKCSECFKCWNKKHQNIVVKMH